MALHFECCPTTLPDEQVNEYLLLLRDTQSPSYSYFKHTVYGLRMAFRLAGREDKAIRLPSIQRIKSLPAVFNRAEVKKLVATPKWKKHRILLALIYSAGLRISEASNLEQRDIDFGRMAIHIRESKYKKDRYVPLSGYMKQGLQGYYQHSCPIKYVFNGKASGSALSTRAIQYIFRESLRKSGITKKANVHTLRHSYATHLLEEGVDIISLRDLLGHQDIQTTLDYLHVAQFERSQVHSPLDTLYGWQGE